MNRNDKHVAAFTMLAHPIFHAYELVIPIFLVIWIDTFSTTPVVLGTVVGISYALIGVGAIPTGILADRVSAKGLIIVCLLGMGGAFVLVSIAPTLSVLAIALVVWGSAASIYHPAGLALISRSANNREAIFGYHGAAGNVGVAVGPLLAAVLLVFFDWRTVALILVLPAIVAVLLALQLDFDETAGSVARRTATASDADHEIRRVKDFVSKSKLLFTGGFVVVFVIGILYGIYYRGAFTFLPDILARLPIFEPITFVGRELQPAQYVYSGLLLVGGVGQFVGGKIVGRIRVEYVLIWSYLILVAISVTFIPAANAGLVPLLIVSGLLGFVVFMIAPVNQEAIATYSAADVRGLSFGYTYAAIFGVGAVGATLSGVVLTLSSATVLFGILAVIVGVSAILGIYLIR